MKVKRITALLSLMLAGSVLFAGCGQTQTPTDAETTASQTAQSETTADTMPFAEASSTADDASEQTSAPVQTSETEIEAPSEAPARSVTVYRCEGKRKIWAGIVGEIYVLFKDIETPNGNGLQGQVYELYVDAGDGYTVWSDGYWSMNESRTELTLTPKHQSENGNIGVAENATKTYSAEKGAFKVEFSFEQGGKSSIKLNPAEDAV